MRFLNRVCFAVVSEALFAIFLIMCYNPAIFCIKLLLPMYIFHDLRVSPSEVFHY